jgi:hypothetical protein
MAADEDTLKRRYREFMDLLPVAIEIAGLPQSEGAFNFTAEQMEIRANTLAMAFKYAKQLVREVVTQ